ncbi:MAG: hypothetical protein V4594_03915 [Bacteroidota bacterium]
MKTKYLYLLIASLLIFNACKKEYPNLPYTDMLNFSLKDANGETLKAAIENGKIIVYWPPQQALPATITPEFSIAEKAKVSPASGTAVAFNDQTAYTITAENGTSATYQLKVVVNSPIPVLTGVFGIQTYNSKVFAIPASPISITGDFFDVAAGKTKVTLLGTNDQEIEARVSNATEVSIEAYPEAPLGNYKGVKVVVSGKSVTHLQDFALIADNRPNLPVTTIQQPITLKQGALLTITAGKDLQNINKAELYNLTTRKYISIIVKEAKAGSLILQIPEDFPVGSCNRLRYWYPATEYYAESGFVLGIAETPITIIEK